MGKESTEDREEGRRRVSKIQQLRRETVRVTVHTTVQLQSFQEFSVHTAGESLVSNRRTVHGCYKIEDS